MTTLKQHLDQINRLSHESDTIYHAIAVQYGLSDSVFWSLYALYNAHEPIAQTDLCDLLYFSKQTVNSAMVSMMRQGWITLKPVPGTRNRKHILLTDEGRSFCNLTIGSVREMELAALSRLTEDEREAFVALFARYNQYMQDERAACVARATRANGEEQAIYDSAPHFEVSE